MRFLFFLSLACLVTSCAYQGTIVEKQSRPHPFYHSLGIEGVYNFKLRDNASAVHSQMVTPQVFDQYAVGDYFNDLQPGGPRGDAKSAETAFVQPTNAAQMQTAMHQPTFSVTRTASVTQRAPAVRVAATAQTTPVRKSVASTSSTKPNAKRVASRVQTSSAAPARIATSAPTTASHLQKSNAAPARKAMHEPTFSVARTANATKPAPPTRVAAVTSTTARKSVAPTSSTKPSAKHIASHAQTTTHKKSLAEHPKQSGAKNSIASTSSKRSKHTAAAKSKTRKPWKLTEPNGPSVDVSTSHTVGPTPIPAEGPDPKQQPQ